MKTKGYAKFRGRGGGGGEQIRCIKGDVKVANSFSPQEPLVLIDHVTKRKDGVNFMRCPKGQRSMGSNDNLLDKYFRAKYIDTRIECLFHISFAFFWRLQESYALSSLFFLY